ncbi:unnamed protein product [Spirodela intermedia]|uniref:Uncharacterized protein n=1 Tax=Spirodela intermedia TaxID=51605 RepID=A0A7I8ITA9_SPIIN|nr:unnamed protein product [Spirodela intermedia]CAA6660784.1 unnamed protein product [Spirodela intermedia]
MRANRRPTRDSNSLCPCLPSPPVDVIEKIVEPIPSDGHHNPPEEPRDGQMSWAINELNGRTTDVRDSTSACATAGEEAPSDPTIDCMINGQNQSAIKASIDAIAFTSITMPKAPPSDGDHVAVKVLQPFVVVDASAVTLLTSSTSDAADVGIARNLAPSRVESNSTGTVQAWPVRASTKVARAELAQVALSEAALAQAMPPQAKQTESEQTLVEPAQPIDTAPFQDAPAQA